MSLKDKILSAQLKSETVFVPQWGENVLVRELNGGQRAKFMEKTMTVNKQGEAQINISNMNFEIALLSCCDPETGERLFKESDRESLLSTSAAAIDVVAAVGLRLSALNGTAVEEVEKN